MILSIVTCFGKSKLIKSPPDDEYSIVVPRKDYRMLDCNGINVHDENIKVNCIGFNKI